MAAPSIIEQVPEEDLPVVTQSLLGLSLGEEPIVGQDETMFRSSTEPSAGRAAQSAVLKSPASGGAPALYTYVPAPGVPPISVFRIADDAVAVAAGRHAHDFPAIAFFEGDGGALVANSRRWSVRAGDLFVIPPGFVMAGEDLPALVAAGGWGVAFTPEALAGYAPGSFLAWRGHPLLGAFAAGAAASALRLTVPTRQRAGFRARLTALETELALRTDGYREAVIGHLTLLLVDIARLAVDVPGDLRLNDQPLLAKVFEVIEERFRERLSLSDVARAVNLSPGYLTTVVRERTGRTILEWIVERRMAEARGLLVATDHSVEEIAHLVGYADSAYFVRSFRRTHTTTPLAWRRAGR
jgi:AraC family transcriptional activator of pobA